MPDDTKPSEEQVARAKRLRQRIEDLKSEGPARQPAEGRKPSLREQVEDRALEER